MVMLWQCMLFFLAFADALPTKGKNAASRISNIIVLMMENRSFDHLLGWLKQEGAKIEGLDEGMSLPRDPSDPSKGYVPVTRNGLDVCQDDPKHDFDNIALQINHGAMDGFIYDSLKNGLSEVNPVSMFDSTTAPIINTLAQEFALFDRWFCSIPTSTDPNRQFAMSGTSLGVTTNFNGTLYPQQSYLDYLRRNNRTFAGFYQDDLWMLGAFEDLLQTENSRFIRELEPYFFDDAKAGTLPDFTWLQPRFSTYDGKLPTWQHPDASVLEGERLIKQVYEAIRAGPKWNETLFIVTYDEHGGFYDHVNPPSEGVPAPDGYIAENGFKFDQLGIRIPTIAISPWIAKGTVVSGPISKEEMPTETSQFDSTSIMATSNIILGLDKDSVPPLGERMAWANTFLGLVEALEEPRKDCPATLPELPAAEPAMYQEERLKPLNEHMISQLKFYCVMNYPTEEAAGACPGRPEVMNNQGKASDWMIKELASFKIRQQMQQQRRGVA